MNEIFHRTSIRNYLDKPVEPEKQRKCCRLPKYSQIDLSASVENLLLEADSLDLGAVWLGIAPLEERMQAARDVLHLPEELATFAIIPCGYPESIHAQQNRFDMERIHYI